jgi:hypothetical protein
MCSAFSCIVTKSGKVYWKAGLDSHENILDLGKGDKDLIDNKMPPDNTFARIEIIPQDGDYLNVRQKWSYIIDERLVPSFLNNTHEIMCRKALKEWMKQVYTFNINEAKKPINPFKIVPPKIGKKQLRLLSRWASVRASVGDSVRASVGASVRASVWDSVWDSVWASVRASVWASVGDSVRASVGDSVRASVWDSVGAYNGSLFPIKEWEYVDYTKTDLFKIGKYPFQPCVDLWKMGLVPSYNGEVWRLHGGKNAEILWEDDKLLQTLLL